MIAKSPRGRDGISRHQSNRLLGKSKGDEDHDTLSRGVLEDAIEQRRHREKGMASKRYQVFQVNDNPEPVDWKNRWEVTHQEEFIMGGAMPQYRRDTRGVNSRRWIMILSWIVVLQQTSAPRGLRNGIKGEYHGHNHDRKGPNHRCKE